MVAVSVFDIIPSRSRLVPTRTGNPSRCRLGLSLAVALDKTDRTPARAAMINLARNEDRG